MSSVIFFIAAIGAIAGAIGVVALRNPFYGVLALVGHLISLAALFLLLRAEFVAASQVVVYAGAVMVLYIFVVSYIGDDITTLDQNGPKLRKLGIVFAAAIFVELCAATLGTGLKAVGEFGAPYSPGFGSPEQIGEFLLTKFLLPFEVASLLLFVAAVGAVTLARRRVDDLAPEITETRRPENTGTMAEGVGRNV